MTLATLLDSFRDAAVSEREKGGYFEELIAAYLRHEASYRDLYCDVWSYSQWAALQHLDQRDSGIDLVARTYGTDELHAIQCKFYHEDHRIQKSDIDSFFTASGKKIFSQRIIVATTNHWSDHAAAALADQQPPVSKIDLQDLENSQIDWDRYIPHQQPILKHRKELRSHQKIALEKVVNGLVDRGQLIMACGTGKTLTSLRIAEQIAGVGQSVLVLVPSLALLSQILSEWSQQSKIPLHSFAVCSDSAVGKQRKPNDDDRITTFTHELRYPATTDAKKLASEMQKRHDEHHLSVIFATYHSIGIISQAQKEYQLAHFALIICDEAHRTTGAFGDQQNESYFTQVHRHDFIAASKRLYMTATPRVYGTNAKASAEQANITLCSMDDPSLYGHPLYILNFSEAVTRGLLADYKVIVLAVEETHVSRRLQELLKENEQELKIDDAAKIVGCWKALTKQGLTNDLADDPAMMQRAVAFCQVIERNKNARTHQVSSKQIARMFQKVITSYLASEPSDDNYSVNCAAAHVDGYMNASEKGEKINWLKAELPANHCRILTNVRCLSEGVDVPALDAILFLTPRNSQIEVVQAIGRVMRITPGKKRGYVILPVVIPSGREAHTALNDNQTYSVVWQVLQALRAHDDRFDAMINKIDLIGNDPSKMEIIAVTDKILSKRTVANQQFTMGKDAERPHYGPDDLYQFDFSIGILERAIYAKVVQKVGNRHHWEDWANDIAKIAATHIDRITTIIANPTNQRERATFKNFAEALRKDINQSLSDAEIIEMLAQHLITKPVFDALFANYSFTASNPMSQAMQQVVTSLEQHHIHQEADTLTAFYRSVQLRATGIENAAGRQKIIIELYDKFFRNAFPQLTARLGIVYTPIEVVDFILHSVAHLLQTEFQQTLGDEAVHILDPFTGTGTFITRLLQSGLITPQQLPAKYAQAIHANEIVLLAYYIAAINIESTYHELVGGDYLPFPGICLTDTFQLHENRDLVNSLLIDNRTRHEQQQKLDIQVIMGNPPYSVGQNSANDNNQKTDYEDLDQRIRDSYAAHSRATAKKSLYDSYIRALRWASDRIGNQGIIGFVSGSGFAEKPAMDGLRKCFAEEFASIYIINLRGDIRKNMLSQGRANEGQNIFGSGSMTGIAISLLVKNPKAGSKGQIYYHDIGDHLTREEKLAKIGACKNIAGITATAGWQSITPDHHGDWLNQRNHDFNQFIVLGDKRSDVPKLFDNFSLGVKTSRDAWCYNFSREGLAKNMQRMIAFYNSEVARFKQEHENINKQTREARVDNFVNNDSTKISWSRSLKQELLKERQFDYDPRCLVKSLYRPFTKQWLYFNRRFNERVCQMPRIFPDAAAENMVIGVSGIGARSGFSVLISEMVPCMGNIETGQCFPLYIYDELDKETQASGELFAGWVAKRTRREAITDQGLAHFQQHYPGELLTKEDLFYYVYGLLHAPAYRERYANNLTKELPRILAVRGADKFWQFSQAGRDLAALHLHYEHVPMAAVTITGDDGQSYRVEKMRYGRIGKDKDRTTIHYNERITISDIPLEAYEYIVNGKAAIDWVIERQGVRVEKDSGITNDANCWASEVMNNPRYPLELLLRIITVSVETMKIIKTLKE